MDTSKLSLVASTIISQFGAGVDHSIFAKQISTLPAAGAVKAIEESMDPNSLAVAVQAELGRKKNRTAVLEALETRLETLLKPEPKPNVDENPLDFAMQVRQARMIDARTMIDRCTSRAELEAALSEEKVRQVPRPMLLRAIENRMRELPSPVAVGVDHGAEGGARQVVVNATIENGEIVKIDEMSMSADRIGAPHHPEDEGLDEAIRESILQQIQRTDTIETLMVLLDNADQAIKLEAEIRIADLFSRQVSKSPEEAALELLDNPPLLFATHRAGHAELAGSERPTVMSKIRASLARAGFYSIEKWWGPGGLPALLVRVDLQPIAAVHAAVMSMTDRAQLEEARAYLGQTDEEAITRMQRVIPTKMAMTLPTLINTRLAALAVPPPKAALEPREDDGISIEEINLVHLDLEPKVSSQTYDLMREWMGPAVERPADIPEAAQAPAPDESDEFTAALLGTTASAIRMARGGEPVSTDIREASVIIDGFRQNLVMDRFTTVEGESISVSYRWISDAGLVLEAVSEGAAIDALLALPNVTGELMPRFELGAVNDLDAEDVAETPSDDPAPDMGEPVVNLEPVDVADGSSPETQDGDGDEDSGEEPTGQIYDLDSIPSHLHAALRKRNGGFRRLLTAIRGLRKHEATPIILACLDAGYLNEARVHAMVRNTPWMIQACNQALAGNVASPSADETSAPASLENDRPTQPARPIERPKAGRTIDTMLESLGGSHEVEDALIEQYYRQFADVMALRAKLARRGIEV